jgi:hypothetical protein
VSVFESQATFNVEEATRFEPGMPITSVNLEPNIKILDTIVCTAQTHCKHKHASRLIDVCNKCPRLVNAEPFSVTRFLKTDALGKSVLNKMNALCVKLGYSDFPILYKKSKV